MASQDVEHSKFILFSTYCSKQSHYTMAQHRGGFAPGSFKKGSGVQQRKRDHFDGEEDREMVRLWLEVERMESCLGTPTK